jgi:O-succinylbenzoate synthase
MEITDLRFHRYELTPKSAPNRLSSAQPRRGCLLKVKFADLAHAGYADLFPWPELGDEPLELQLAALNDRIPFRQGAAAISWAHYEAQAKQKNLTLLSDAGCPSHVTLLDRHVIPAGFTTAKLKITHEDIHRWDEVERFFVKFPQMLWRLDFNGLFNTIKDAHSFWDHVSPAAKERIEFLEDPYHADLMEMPDALSVFDGTDVAVDRNPTPVALDLAQVWVIKPVYFSPDYLFSEARSFSGKVVITSNMDHPLGQITALHATQRLQKTLGTRLLPGGLLTQDLYQTHEHRSWVKQQGECLWPTQTGAGWGLNEQLEALDWQQP